MIKKIFDFGWGPEWPVKQYETEIVNQYLRSLIQGPQQLVMINSTWYGQTQHQQVLDYLRNNDFTHLALISMIDPAIPKADWFAEFDVPIIELGSYLGQHEIVFWALVSNRSHQFADDAVLTDVSDVDLPFMCLNRKPHWHRQRLYKELDKSGLLDKGIVSMGSDQGPAIRPLENDIDHCELAPNSDLNHHGIVNDFSLGHMTNWRRHFLNIVTETAWGIDKHWFVSEKIFKPIVGCRPFLVYDVNGAGGWLESHGFASYVDDFRDISDADLRDPSAIAKFLSILAQQEKLYFRSKYFDLRDKILYNKQRLSRMVQEQSNKIQQGITCPI